MTTGSRKERQFQAREHLILEKADLRIRKDGYLGLNLDGLADEVEYSKGTLYQHFKSKEDLVLGVVNRHFEIRRDFFQRAFDMKGQTRERLFAFGIGDFVLSELLPHAFSIGQLAHTGSIWDKCSEKRQRHHDQLADACFELAFRLAEEAKALGDLAPDSPSPRQIIWGIVSLSKGAHLLDDLGLVEAGSNDGPKHFLIDNYHRFLDGAGWRPLLHEHDYQSVEKMIRDTLFAKEFAQLQQS